MSDSLAKIREQLTALWAGTKPAARVAIVSLPVLFAIGLALFVGRFGSSSGYEVLFAHMRAEDAAEVVAALREQGIPYRLERNGEEIWVPRKDVPSLRLDLAAQGLPRGGVVGFEAFDATRLGMTDFERQVQYQRALQGELTRTIRAFDQVQDARVHITIPERSLFIGQQRDASASVVLQLRPGMSLGASQVQAIVHLLARSVEGLKPEQITVVDTRGNVLSDLILSEQTTTGSDVVSRQLEIRQRYEAWLSQDVQALLERVYGHGNVVARVNAELNFDHLEELSEIFSSPTNGKTGLPRSTQTFEESFQGSMVGPGGVPGVQSNIPGYVADSNSESGSYERREETVNYELNRTVVNRQVAPGDVRRLSVAIIIDGDLDEGQRENIKESVAAVVGLNPARGDMVSVQSMQFESAPVLAGLSTDAAIGSQFSFLYLFIAVVLLAGLLLLMLARTKKQAAREGIDIVVEEAFELSEPMLSSEERRKKSVRSRIEAAAKERPHEVARLLRGWLAED